MNPFNKPETQSKDFFDDTGLNFELNAAIESNPFQKRRNLQKEKTEAISTNQITTEAPKERTYTTSTIQKTTLGTATTKDQPFGTKQSAFPEKTTINKGPIDLTSSQEKTPITTSIGNFPAQKEVSQTQFTRNETKKTYTATFNQDRTIQQNPPVQEKSSTGTVPTGTAYTRGVTPSYTSTLSNKTEPSRIGATTYGLRNINKETSVVSNSNEQNEALKKPEQQKTLISHQETPPRENQASFQLGGIENNPINTTSVSNPNDITKGVSPQTIKNAPPKFTASTYQKSVVQTDTYKSPEKITQNQHSPASATNVSSHKKEPTLPTKSESDKLGSAHSNAPRTFTPGSSQRTPIDFAKSRGTPVTSFSGSKANILTSPKETPTVSQHPRNLLISRNNTKGLMLLNSKNRSNHTLDIQNKYLNTLKQEAISYPGPYRFDKKSLLDKRSELLKFLEGKIDESTNFVIRLSLMVLREYLKNNSSSLFKDMAARSREVLSNEIYHFTLDVALSNLTNEYREYFNYSTDYLINMENLSFQDNSWEDVLFKSLFLRNTTFVIDPTNLDFILNYIRSKFAPGDPIHTVSMVKLGFFHEIFETPFFVENNIHDIWPLLIYPCLRFYNTIPHYNIEYFFNSLALKVIETKKGTQNGLLALFITMLTGTFDPETLDGVSKSAKHPSFAQILESYYFVLKSNDHNFDKNYNLLSKTLRLSLYYSYYLLDLGEFDKTKEYLDCIINSRPYFNELENDNVYLRQIRVIRDLIINHYTIIEESKSSVNQGKFLASKKDEIKQSATQTIQKLQAKGKSLFGFVNNAKNAFSSFMNAPDTQAFQALAEKIEEEKNKEQTLTTSISTSITTSPPHITQGNITTAKQVSVMEPFKDTPPVTKAKVNEDERPPMFPQKFPPPTKVEKPLEEPVKEEIPKEEPSKINKASMSNPFSGVSKGPTTTTIKRIPQNRYVSPFQ